MGDVSRTQRERPRFEDAMRLALQSTEGTVAPRMLERVKMWTPSRASGRNTALGTRFGRLTSRRNGQGF